MKYSLLVTCIILLFLKVSIISQENKKTGVWIADNGDGTYTNPIIHADYSDPDVIRVGTNFYMTASSFNCIPGLPILQSSDLVNWKLISYALPKLLPEEVYNEPRHGNGVWAPCLRYHNNEYYIYYPDPDFGIFVVRTKNPAKEWSEPVLVKKGKGLIDPTPLWDNDGKAYLAYAFAGSRAGIKSIIAVCSMNSEGTKANNDDKIVFDGHKNHPTIEGPKFYKRNGYYYIFAPAGGVPKGWQLVLRSKQVFGPYEEKIVLEQGHTNINGPHQGAWVQTQNGEDWFIHFQDKGSYGRIVHLQPMKWVNDWPVIGEDEDNNGVGNPVYKYKKPNVGKNFPIETLPESDEFNSSNLGLQWQWHANPQIYWGFPTAFGYYTIFCRPKPDNYSNLFDVPNILLQKFPSEKFKASIKITFHPNFDNEQFGFVVMGLDYAYLSVKQKEGKLFLSQNICKDADKKSAENEIEGIPISSNTLFMQIEIKQGGVCNFLYSENGEKFIPIGISFTAREGKWIGAKIGFFALRDGFINNAGSADIDWFRIE